VNTDKYKDIGATDLKSLPASYKGRGLKFALISLQHITGLCGLIVLIFAQAACGRSSETTRPAGAESVTEGLWDEDGTIEGYEKMIQRYAGALQKNPADINALAETAYAYCKMAWIRHLNAQYSIYGKLGGNTFPPEEIAPLYGQADLFLGRAKNIDPSAEVVLAVDSIIQRSLGHNPEALSLANQAGQSDSSNPRVLEAYEITKIKATESRDLYKQIVSIAPGNAYYWWQLGNFETDADAKSAAYNKALELSPNYALPKISLAMSKWMMSSDRIKGLDEIAKASPELDAFAQYNRLLSIVYASGLVLVWLLSIIFFKAKSMNWLWLMAIYLVLWCVLTFAPTIGDKTIFLLSLQETLSSVLSVLSFLLIFDLARAWFWPEAYTPYHRLARLSVRGMLAGVRAIFQIPIDSSRADLSYFVVGAELWLLNLFVQNVFVRLSRWW
jgi:tetratricopeptide (TPR) repeat protein